MNTRFEIAYGVGPITTSALVYRPEDYSFDMEPAPVKNFTSILIGDLNLEIDSSGRVISIWGMCPHTKWQERVLTPPPSKPGSLFVISDRLFKRGVSERLSTDKYLPTFVDRSSGWIRVKMKETSIASVMVLPGVIVEIGADDQLSSVWLRPKRGIVRPITA